MDPKSFLGPRACCPSPPKASRSNSSPRDSTIPRLIRTAPNGDLFLAESETGKIKVFRGVDSDGKAAQVAVFAEGLHQPFGIAFYPSGAKPAWVYIGDTDGIVRFPTNGDLKAAGTLPAHCRSARRRKVARRRPLDPDVVFSKDGTKLFASVGSHSNVDDSDTHPEEFHRADVLEFTPEANSSRSSHGLRNCVGEAINPITGELWCSTNERDGLGNNLVPDYVTHVQEDGFYGWPWFTTAVQRAAFKTRATPANIRNCSQSDHPRYPGESAFRFARYDVLSGLGGSQPSSLGRRIRRRDTAPGTVPSEAGYEVIRLPMVNGHSTGEYEDFLTGFVLPNGAVWGRPVGVARQGRLALRLR